jgi:hypothetical protein
MRRKRNRIFKRLVLGFAVAALVVPSAAMARVDEGGAVLPNGSTVGGLKASDSAFAIENARLNSRGTSSSISIEDVRLNPRGAQVVKAGEYGMPRAMPSDYGLQRGDSIEIARTHPRNVVTADIENVRLQPRTTSTPEAVASSSFDWGDAGIGAGLFLGLVLIGGLAFYATRHLGKPETA